MVNKQCHLKNSTQLSTAPSGGRSENTVGTKDKTSKAPRKKQTLLCKTLHNRQDNKQPDWTLKK